MEQVTKQDLIDYFDFLVNHEHLEPYTIVTHKILVKKFFKWLYNTKETGKIPEQVLWIEVNKKKAYKTKTKADMLTQEQLKQREKWRQTYQRLKSKYREWNRRYSENLKAKKLAEQKKSKKKVTQKQ